MKPEGAAAASYTKGKPLDAQMEKEEALYAILFPDDTYNKGPKSRDKLVEALRKYADKLEALPSRHQNIVFPDYSTRMVAIELLYLGFDCDGYACQPDTERTIESYLFRALVATCLVPEDYTFESLRYTRCGRTDKGVSAYRQVIALRVRSRARAGAELPGVAEEVDYPTVINRQLPPTVRATAWCPVPDDFNARYGASYREYKYFFTAHKGLSVALMSDAAARLEGEHDFRNFCKLNADNVGNLVRKIFFARIEEVSGRGEGAAGEDPKYMLHIRGTGFLWHQIRCIMTVLFLVGQGKEPPGTVSDMLDVRPGGEAGGWRGGKPQYPLADPEPLVLADCGFEGVSWVLPRTSGRVLADLREYSDGLASRALVAQHGYDCVRQSYQLIEAQAGAVPRPLSDEASSLKHVALADRPREMPVEERLKKLRKIEGPGGGPAGAAGRGEGGDGGAPGGGPGRGAHGDVGGGRAAEAEASDLAADRVAGAARTPGGPGGEKRVRAPQLLGTAAGGQDDGGD